MKKMLFPLLGLLIATHSFAGTSNKTGIKLGGSAYAYHSEAVEGAAALSNFNASFGWHVFAGVRLCDLLGARVGYYQLADTEHAQSGRYGRDHYFLKAYDAVLTVNLPLGYATDVTLFGGGAIIDQDVFNLDKITDSKPLADIDIKQVVPEVGVGLHFQHNRLFATEWTYTHFHGTNNVNDINMLSFGVTFTIPL